MLGTILTDGPKNKVFIQICKVNTIRLPLIPKDGEINLLTKLKISLPITYTNSYQYNKKDTPMIHDLKLGNNSWTKDKGNQWHEAYLDLRWNTCIKLTKISSRCSPKLFLGISYIKHLKKCFFTDIQKPPEKRAQFNNFSHVWHSSLY